METDNPKQGPPGPPITEEPGAQEAAGTQIRRFPRVDRRRTWRATAALGGAVALFSLLAAVDAEAGPAWYVWTGVNIVGLVGVGYWLAKTSQASGYLGSAVLGATVGLVNVLVLDAALGFDLPGIIIGVLMGTLLASVGGMAGWRRRPIEPAQHRHEREWRPQRYRRYFLGTGVVSIILVTWLVLYGDTSPTALLVLITLALAVPLLLYPRYDSRLRNAAGQFVVPLLGIWTGLVLATAAVVLVLSIFNLPRQGAFDEELVMVWGPQSEQDAWDRLVELTTGPDADDRTDEAMDLLASGPISMSQRDFGLDTVLPRIVGFSGLASSGIEETKGLLEQGRDREAYEEYLRRWTIAHNLIAGRGTITLIQFLVGAGAGLGLAEFFLDDDAAVALPVDQRLPELLGDMEDALATGYRSAMTGEYAWSKQFFTDDPEFACDVDFEFMYAIAGVCLLHLPWPFYDKNSTEKTRHDLFVKAINIGLEPPYGDRDRLRNEYQDQFDEAVRFTLMENPVGSAVLRDTLPLVMGFAGRGGELERRLVIMSYVLESSLSGNYGNVPTDPHTGKPFRVTDHGDTVEVASDQDPGLSYKIKKRVP